MLWFDDPVAAARDLPPLVLPMLVLISALLEYVVPPYPGDTVVLLAFFLAGQGAASPLELLIAALLGSMIGAVIAYELGRRYGILLVDRLPERYRRPRYRRYARELLHRFGERTLAVNRFLPIVRGVMLYAAGTFRLRFGPSLLYTAVSNVAFMTFMLWLGLAAAGSWQQLLANARHYNQLLGVAVVVALGVWMATTLWRLRIGRLSSR